MDPVTVLVHSSGAYVNIGFVSGEVLVSNGKLLRIDEDEIARKPTPQWQVYSKEVMLERRTLCS
jgi:hypothetical protein